MKIEQQACTLEQAKRLKELGIIQDSVSWWKCNDEQEVVICGCHKEMNERHFYFNTWYSAFTVAELGVMMPEYIHPFENEEYYRLMTWKMCSDNRNQNEKFGIRYRSKFGIKDFPTFHSEHGSSYQLQGQTEAEARAAMLIYLLENNLITAEEVNQRLNQ